MNIIYSTVNKKDFKGVTRSIKSKRDGVPMIRYIITAEAQARYKEDSRILKEVKAGRYSFLKVDYLEYIKVIDIDPALEGRPLPAAILDRMDFHLCSAVIKGATQ